MLPDAILFCLLDQLGEGVRVLVLEQFLQILTTASDGMKFRMFFSQINSYFSSKGALECAVLLGYIERNLYNGQY
jgi:hypothetical protein